MPPKPGLLQLIPLPNVAIPFGTFAVGTLPLSIWYLDTTNHVLYRPADDGTVLIPELGPIVKRKTANEAISSGTSGTPTTLQDDDHLGFTVLPNSVYLVDCHILYVADASGDLKAKWTVPSGATGTLDALYVSLGATASSAMSSFSGDWATTFTAGGIGIGVPIIMVMSGILITTGAGTVILQWAQNSSHANATTLLIGSYVKAQRIG